MQEPVLAVSGDRKVQWFNAQMARIAEPPLRMGDFFVESIRDPEVVRAIRRTLESREISSARSELFATGRVFNMGLGHRPEFYESAKMQQMVLAGIQFILGDLKANADPGVNSAAR